MKDKILLEDEKQINNNISEFEKKGCMKEYKLRALQNFALKLDVNIKGLKKNELCKEIVKRLRTSRITKQNISDKIDLINQDKLILKEDINSISSSEIYN